MNRCMSFASSAPPSCASRPATAKLLLPTAPRSPRPKGDVLEWPGAESGQAVVDAGNVGVEDGAVVTAQQVDRTSRNGAEAMDANLAIRVDCASADERRELTGGASARKVHLEVAI